MLLIRSCVEVKDDTFPIQLINLGDTDVWLKPGVRVGVLNSAHVVSGDDYKFSMCPADVVNVEKVVAERDKKGPSVPVDISDFHGTQDQHAQLCALLARHRNAFVLNEDDVGYTEEITHEIITEDEVPTAQPYRRVP